MMSKKIVAGILAAAITVSSIAPEAFAEISGVGVGGTSTVNESTVDTSTDPASVGSDKTEEPGEPVPRDSNGAVPEPGEDESVYTYNALDDGTIEITGYSGSAENIVIPAQIDGKSVTRIGNNAFEKSSAKEIVIPDSVTEIGSQAFSGCGKLTSVLIPNSVTMIRDRAFFDCNSLASITIPDSVTDIELQAFCNCTSLKEVTIPASVTYIGDEAFGYYSDIDGSEIKKVDGFKINYAKNTYGHYYATKNGFSDEDCIITNELSDGTLEISNYAGNSATYEIPGEIDGKKVVRIGDSAFIDCTELTSVTIPDGVTDICWRAFYNCVSLKSVTIPESVINIDNYAFGYYYDSNSFGTKKIDGFKINYVKNTYGHYYATKNGFSDEDCLLTNELYDGTLEITEYVGNSATYVIPSEIDGKKVTQIGYDAFNDCTELTSITIPDGVTCIGNSAFSYCTSLETVTIPNSVTQIYSRAFYDCTLLKEVTIPASVTSIGNEAFGYYYVRDSSETKKADGFKINYVNNTRGHWYAIKNGFTDEACLLTELQDDGTLKISKYIGSDTVYVIPDEIDGKKVTSIGSDAFQKCTSLTSITIPDSVTDIEQYAFEGCTSLSDITLPDSLTSIGLSAFESCTALTDIALPDSLTYIDGFAFANCTSLKTVTVPASVTFIGGWAFGYYFEDGNIDARVAFDDFTINYTKHTAGHLYAIENGFTDEACLLTELQDDGTLKISKYIGSDTVYVIPDEIDGKKVTSIGYSAFENLTSLTSVTIPDSVTDIGFQAFHNCTSLKSVTIPASVISIGTYAFGYFYDANKETKIDGFKINYTKNTAGHLYAAQNGFTDEACLINELQDDGTVIITKYAGNDTVYEIPSEIDGKKVTGIGNRAFQNSTSLTNVTIPDGVTHIDECAFQGCSSLTDIALPDSLTIIDSYAFNNCAMLTSITIPNGVTRIEWETFYGCSALTDLVLPDTVTYIGRNAFFNCPSLKTVTIPASVTDIGEYAFGYHDDDNWNPAKTDGFKINYTKNTWGHYYAKQNGFSDEPCLVAELNEDGTTLKISKYDGNDTEYVIPEEIDGKKVTSIGNDAFQGNTSLISVTIPGSIKDIGNNAFSDCSSLESVTISDGVERILYRAFYNCTSLKTVTVPASVTYIDNNALGYYSDDGGININKIDGFTINYTKYTHGHLYATANGFTDEGYLYFNILDDDTVEIKRYIGNDTVYEIPAEIDGKQVTGITNYAFGNCSSLTSVTIPDSVTIIRFQAFHNCPSLKTVTIPASVTTIGDYAFGYFDDEYQKTKIDGFKINYTKNTAGHRYAFENGFTDETCLLTEIQEDGTVKITKYCGNDTSFVIPAEIDGKPVTSIGYRAFADSTLLTSITIPDSVKYIEMGAFASCTSLTDIVLPASLITIDTEAFRNCTSLTSVTIPDGVTDIGSYAFASCSALTKISLPDSVVVIGDRAFFDCPLLKSVTVPASVTDIGEYAFGYHYDDDWYYTKTDGFKIYCYGGTAGEQYAKDNGFEYKILECKVHKFGEWKTTKPATCTATGTKTRSCSVCGKVEKQTIAKTAHKYVNTVVKPTYAAQGYTLHKCSVCGASYKDNETSKLTLAKVTGFKVKSLTSTNVTLQWNKNANASGYEIEQYKDGKWVNVAKITGNATTSYTVKGLKAGTAGYQFRIRAYRTEGKNKAYSGYSATVKVNTNPYGVSGFKCSSKTSTSVTLKWNKGTTASGYQLQQYKNGKWVTIYTGTKAANTSYTVKKLKAGTAGYRFRIRAYKTYGNTKQYGSWSSEVKVNTNPYGVGGFKCSSKSSTSVTLKWNKGTTASGYQLQQYKNGKWVTIYTGTKATNTSYTVKGLKAGTAGYRFRIRAYKTYGNTKQYGSWSSEVKVNTNPYGVGGFKAKSTAKNSITLGWNKGTTASGYQLQQYKGGKWVTVYTGTKATSTSYTVKSLKSNTSYKFRIRAYKTYGNAKQYGSWSGTLTVRTKK